MIVDLVMCFVLKEIKKRLSTVLKIIQPSWKKVFRLGFLQSILNYYVFPKGHC